MGKNDPVSPPDSAHGGIERDLAAYEQRLILWLKCERIRQGLSATKLAEMTGISRATITHLESGRNQPTLMTLLRMAHGLGIDPPDWGPVKINVLD